MAVACTINEINLALLVEMDGVLGPFHSERRAESLPAPFPYCHPSRSRDVLIDAHTRAVQVIGEVAPALPVGMTLHMHEWVAVDGGDDLMARLRQRTEDDFLQLARGDSFIGIQTYGQKCVGPNGPCRLPGDHEYDALGNRIAPQALESSLRHAAAVARVPVLITESGLCTDDDPRRVRYLGQVLAGVARCLDDGIDVRGYLYWSAFDNYEWRLGYGPKFGIIGVDRQTMERRPKPSASWLGALGRPLAHPLSAAFARARTSGPEGEVT